MEERKRVRLLAIRCERHSCLFAACFAAIAALIMVLGSPVRAAEPSAPFGMTGAMHGEPGRPTSFVTSAIDSAWSILLFEQHRLTEDMIGTVRDLRSATNIATATGALVVASFIYGILHAVGPGHGKAVITSYMLADKETLRRGIFLAFLSSLIQALSAITLVGGLYLAARATGLQTKWAEAWLETLSWAFVAVIGAWLMFRQIWPMLIRRRAARARAHMGEEHHPLHTDGHLHGHALHAHGRGHDHDHEHAHHHHSGRGPITDEHTRGGGGCGHTHSHAHDAGHDHDDHCGHAHLPGPEELRGELSWARALAISFSIGVRPCTGALLVIIFAATQGLVWAGVLATFAMAFGTALTVSSLAALSVGSRSLAIAMAGAESRWGPYVARSASLLSSTAVFVLGTMFFFASLHPTRPF